jgi:hypothetical protein
MIKKNRELSKPIDLMNVGFTAVAGGDKWEVTSNDADSTYISGGSTYYKYISSGNIEFGGNGTVKLMLIGGGGSGCAKYYGGGSGAGGLYFDDVNVTKGSYTITIGGSNTDSTALGKTAKAGSTGNNIYASGINRGGCGGGGIYGDGQTLTGASAGNDCTDEGQSTSSSGGIAFNGGNHTEYTAGSMTYKHAGGGGGLGAVGTDGIGTTVGAGGDGRTNSQLSNFLSITSSGVDESGTRYIGGGGGACAHHWQTGSGGLGGKGGGTQSGDLAGGGVFGGSSASATANTGSGAGASGRYGTGGAGGSGICIIKFTPN